MASQALPPQPGSLSSVVGWREPWPRFLLVADGPTTPGVQLLADLVAGAPPQARASVCCIEHRPSDWEIMIASHGMAHTTRLQLEDLRSALAESDPTISMCAAIEALVAERTSASVAAPLLVVIDSLDALLVPMSRDEDVSRVFCLLRSMMAMPGVRVATRVSSWRVDVDPFLRLADCRIALGDSADPDCRYTAEVTRIRRSNNDAVGSDVRSVVRYDLLAPGMENSLRLRWLPHGSAKRANAATATKATEEASKRTPTAGLLFNLSLTDTQREARSRVPLPYLDAQEKVHPSNDPSQLDDLCDDDDFLSDDPDDDLDI